MPRSPDSLLLLVVYQFGQPPCWLLGELKILMNSGMNCFSRHPMSQSKFPGILLPVIVHFAAIAAGKPLHLGAATFAFSSRPCQGELLDNFLILFKLFLAVLSNPTRWLNGPWWRMEGIGRKSLAANWLCRSWLQVKKGGWNKTDDKLTALYMIFYSRNLPWTAAPDIHVVWVMFKPPCMRQQCIEVSLRGKKD